MKLLKTIAVSAFFAALIGASAFRMGVAQADSASSTVSSSTGAGASPASAVAPDTDDCSVSPADLAQIQAIQNDPTLSSSQELQQELALRKQLLEQTITCAQTEAQNLQVSLTAVQATGDIANLQAQLSSKLDDVNNFYTIELTKLNGVGIFGSEAIAKETLAYRTGSYDPLSGEVNNFILWSENQSLFATAAARFDETSRAVAFLESATPNTDLQNALDAAGASLAEAQTQNEDAQTALAESLPPDQSLALIQSSLASLSAAYQDFFNVSTIINTILPQ